MWQKIEVEEYMSKSKGEILAEANERLKEAEQGIQEHFDSYYVESKMAPGSIDKTGRNMTILYDCRPIFRRKEA